MNTDCLTYIVTRKTNLHSTDCNSTNEQFTRINKVTWFVVSALANCRHVGTFSCLDPYSSMDQCFFQGQGELESISSKSLKNVRFYFVLDLKFENVIITITSDCAALSE